MRAIRLLLVLLLVPLPARANDAAFAFVGGAPVIQQESDVALVYEHLTFRLFPWESRPVPNEASCPEYLQRVQVESSEDADPRPWRCTQSRWRDGQWLAEPEWSLTRNKELHAELTYRFENRSDVARTIQIGLPFDMPVPDDFDDIIGPTIEEDIADLVTIVDGESVPVARIDLSGDAQAQQGDVHFNRVYLATVSFEPGQVRTLVHRYQSLVTLGLAGGGNMFRYLLRTGRGWAGTIDQLEIEFVLPDVGPCLLSSLEYARDGDTIRVSLSDWEPDRDFQLRWVTNGFLLYERGIQIDGGDANELCDALPVSSPEPRPTLLATLELAYGAPHTPERVSTALPPQSYCSGADLFAMLRENAETGDEDAQRQVAELAYQERDDYPENAPAGLRQCFERAVITETGPPQPDPQ